MKDDISFYKVFKPRSHDEAIIWVLFFFIIAGAIGGSALLSDKTSLIFSSIVFAGIVFSFVFDSLVAARTEENLSLSLSRLANLISEVQEGILIYDDEFRISVINKKAEELLHVRAQDILGKVCSLTSNESTTYPRLFQILFPSLAASVSLQSAPGSYPNITDISFEDPTNIFRVYTNRLTDAHDRNLGFIKVIYNRTEEEVALREKSEFITVAAHQLRTPLTAINWALESLGRDDSISKESKSFVEAASMTAEKLSETVNDLLEAARIEGGKTEYQFEDIDLREALQNAVKKAEILAKEHGVTLEIFLPTDVVTVSGDAAKLGLAFANLIENGIRYNKKGGSVKVSVTKDNTQCEIKVEDTGVGIPKEDIGKLFGKFFRASNVAKQETEGSGLGLFIVKSILDAHQGTIRVESELDKGTIFHITLPLKQYVAI